MRQQNCFILIFSPSLFLEHRRKEAAEVIVHGRLDALRRFPGRRGICDDEQTHNVCLMSVCVCVRVSERDGKLGRVGAFYVRRLPTVGTDGGRSNPNLAVLTNHTETKVSVLWKEESW